MKKDINKVVFLANDLSINDWNSENSKGIILKCNL
jgi:hypothetical protein